MERAPLTTHVKSDDVEMTGEHACAKPPVGSGGQPGADSGGVSQGPILREVTLPSGALGVTFVKNYIKELCEGSPLLGHVQPGERVVAFTREDGSMIECTGMSGAALAHELKQTVHQSGRIITVVVAGMERELFAAIRAKNKERVRELLEMEADVNAYEPADVRARDLRCVSLSPGADRARVALVSIARD